MRGLGRYLSNKTSQFIQNEPQPANVPFIACGTGGAVLKTINGSEWSEKVVTGSSTTSYWRGIAYGNNRYVITGNYGNVSVSQDGDIWSTVVSIDQNKALKVKFLEDIFIAYADSSEGLYYSYDGFTWAYLYSPNVDIVYGNSQNLYVVHEQRIWKSINLQTPWYNVSNIDGLSSSIRLQNYVKVNDKIVAVGLSARTTACIQNDLITWISANQTPIGYERNWLAICYGNGKFVAGSSGGGTIISTDGINWSDEVVQIPGFTGRSGSIFSLAYRNGVFIATGSNSKFSVSNDGVNWSTAGKAGTISKTIFDII